MADFLDLTRGSQITYKGIPYFITGRIDTNTILARTLDGKLTDKIDVSEISTKSCSTSNKLTNVTMPLEMVDENRWQNAVKKRDAVKRVFEDGKDRDVVAHEIGVHPSTLYEFRNKLDLHGFERLIVPSPTGGTGKSRITEKQESLLVDVIKEKYLSDQKDSPAEVYREVKHRCKAEGTPKPGRNTVYRRCYAIDQQIKDKKRDGSKSAKDKYSQTMEGYHEATRPLEIIQIDHTLMDIIIVDDETRQPIGRPWLTIAIDVYSRMVYGFYISLDPPSAMSSALCLQMAVFGKEDWLAERDINHSWLISGLLEALHMDNGKDFYSLTLKRGCDKYDVDMIYRPVGKPEYGAHIERLIGTFMQYMKVLPGATFSNIEEKGDYDSEGKSVMTIFELEKWFAILITGRYHKEVHESLGVTPEERFIVGLQGNAQTPGAGINKVVANKAEFLMDFTPFLMVTVQNYGVQIEKIRYNCRALKRFLHTKDPNTGKTQKYLVRRDPRDISAVFFFDPINQTYIRVPYRKRTRPIISLFELRRARKYLEGMGKDDQSTEDEIFKAHAELKAIVEQARKETKKARRNRQRRKLHRLSTGYEKPTESSSVEELEPLEDDESCDDVLPFDEVEMTSPQGDR
jgi:putative transposase